MIGTIMFQTQLYEATCQTSSSRRPRISYPSIFWHASQVTRHSVLRSRKEKQLFLINSRYMVESIIRHKVYPILSKTRELEQTGHIASRHV